MTRGGESEFKTKAELRREMLEKRRAMTLEEVNAASSVIGDKLLALDAVRNADVVLCYVSSKDNEVDTHRFIELLSPSRVLVPIAMPDRSLLWSSITALSDLAPARFGILEPRPECRHVVEPPRSAPVIVPGVAYCRDGYRIGYGGGYYDRFLAHHSGAKIAPAFDLQLIPFFQSSSYDIPMDIIVTETSTYPSL